MSAPAPQVAARGAPGRGGRVAEGLTERLRCALEASLPLVVRGAGETGQRDERRAGLAVADAAIRGYGIRPEPDSPVPEAAVEVASETLGSLDGFDPAEVAAALASMFESAVGPAGRREEGVVYTPPDVVRFMVREGLAARVASELDIDHDEARAIAGGDPGSLGSADRGRLARLLGRLRIVDPAVGAGAFIAAAADEISSLAELLRDMGIPVSSALVSPREVLERCCHGFEVDPDATRMAGAVLALSCGGADVGTVPRVVTTRNTLLGGLDHPKAKDGWDVVLMNPPYVGEKHLRRRLGNEFQEALRARDGFSGDLLSHFILRALEGVKPGGALSAIVSDTAFTMASAAPVRAALLEQTTLFSLAWCRPFAVAAHGGIVTAIRGRSERRGSVRCFEAARDGELSHARGRNVSLSSYSALPGRPFFRPSAAARTVVGRWHEVGELEESWDRVARQRRTAELEAEIAALKPGEWTLLGAAVRAGQGLATGDDRRFVGFVAGTEAAHDAVRRQHRILEALRADPSRSGEWRHLKRLMANGQQLGVALVALLSRRDGMDGAGLPGRKPFRVIDRNQCRRSALSEEERRYGITDGPTWIPYETSDRSGSAGGARWARENPVVIDWSADAVDLLRWRRSQSSKRPVLRHEELWFRGGVTHNRVASYLRARLMPAHAIFSSESPCYVPAVSWLSELSLLALLNSPVVEFIVKTFLATRNHLELGHLLRVPVPVLAADERHSLEVLAAAAVDSTRSGCPASNEIERELDLLTRSLYGVHKDAKLPVMR